MSGWRFNVCAALGYVLLALVFTWPLALHLSTRLTGPPSGDTGVYVWNQWVFRHELITEHHHPLYTSVIFSLDPQQADLSLHNYTIFADLLALPLVGSGSVAPFNLVYLALMVLSACAMFLLAKDVGGGVPEAWLAGLLFAFSPALIARGTGHFSLVAAAPLPVFLLLLRRAERTGQVRYGIAAGAAVAWAVACDPYYGVYCLLLALWHAGSLVFTVRLAVETAAGVLMSAWRLLFDAFIGAASALMLAIVVTGGATLQLWGRTVGLRSLYTPALVLTVLVALRVALAVRCGLRPGGLQKLLSLARLAAYGAAVCLLLLSPMLFALARRVVEGRYVSAPVFWRSSMPGVDLLSFVIPNPNHPILGGPGRHWLEARSGGFIENVASVAFVAIAVVVVAVRYAGFRPPAYWLGGTLVAASIAVGPFVRLAGFDTYLPTPWALLRYLPVVGDARAPSRLTALVMLGVAVLFVLALRQITTAWPAWRRPILATVFCGLLFELTPAPRTLYSAEIPDIYNQIKADPRDVRVLELPFGVRDGLSSAGDFSPASLFYQTHHHKRLIGGYLSRVSRRRFATARSGAFRRALITLSERKPLPSEETSRLAALAPAFVERWSLAYVVIDRARATPELVRFATEVFGLEKLGESGSRELYGTAIARGVPY